MGGLAVARVPRVPARLGPQSRPFRRRARAAGARRAASAVGEPERGTRRRSRSSRSRQTRWRRSLDGFVPGLPDELRRQVLDPRRGRAAVRRRDRPHAARPRAPRTAREPSIGRSGRSRRSRSRRRSRRSLAARLDGLEAGRAPAAPGRLRRRKEVLERLAGRRDDGAGGRTPTACSPPSCARRSCRSRRTRALPSAGSTAFSRTCCARSPTRRCRAATGRPGICGPPRTSSADSIDGDEEIVEIVASHDLTALELAPDADDAAVLSREGPHDADQGRRPRGLARRERECAALLRAGARARREPTRASRATRARRADGDPRSRATTRPRPISSVR